MKVIKLDESFVRGAVSFEHSGDGIRPWRIRESEKDLYALHGTLISKAGRAAGVRLRFRSNSTVLELDARIVTEDGAPPLVDLVCGQDVLFSTRYQTDTATTRFEGLPGTEMRLYEIWLPVFADVFVNSLRVDADAVVEPVRDDRPRWITYGSSITHCRAAASPANTWPAIAARTLDLNLTCLGFGGECHIDSMIGRQIRDLPADVITLKLGINVYGNGSLNLRSFGPAVMGIVQLIREKHPGTPLGLITAIYGCDRETRANTAGMTLENTREQVRKAYSILRDHGDGQIFLFEGQDLLGEAEAGLLPDQLHPNAEGYARMGEQAAARILPKLLRAVRSSR